MDFCRSRSFLVQRCDVQRASIDIDATTIRDRKVSNYRTIYEDQPCWFEPSGMTINPNDQLGRFPVDSYTVWMDGPARVLPNDRLLKDGEYFIVEAVQSYSAFDFQKMLQVRKQTYAQGQ